MEELKKLYEELHSIPDEDVEARERLWKKILQKHRKSLHDKQKKIDSIIESRVGDLAELVSDLNTLKNSLKEKLNEKKNTEKK
ncbi:MAG: hypothetical protein BAJALOKI3v1_1120004 [Promethearchaeota archaeon]|nr:MAG: hypothetical protein BAJALOKI3v1_1120004 [Candidatus Lokiarchaeota archaeon]